MLLADFLKTEKRLQANALYLEEDYLQLYIGARALIQGINYDLNETKLQVKEQFLTPTRELSALLGIKESTLRNYRVEINQITEARLARDYIRRILECNKRSLQNKLQGVLIDDELDAQLEKLKEELQLAQIKLDKDFLLTEVYPQVVGTPENKYILPDLTAELNFLAVYNSNRLNTELAKLNPDKLRFIHAVLNGDVNNVVLSTSIAELVHSESVATVAFDDRVEVVDDIEEEYYID